MLVEKAGKFDLKSFNMRNWPIMPSRIHKYDFSDSAVIKDTFIQLINEHLKYSTTMEASTIPSINISGSNNDTHHSKEDDDKQNFYSIPPSFENHPLEYWFGTSIYINIYPRMPSDRVLSACDFKQ
ncbi:unnamed protein product [Rotaria sordida]|uniref:Uncharacterized protein n=1 Tax=Rotaria sordida TaxID=392033 RepID=A0A814VV25_9BILA|nr:unnamed protein product [Rotaria sordida]